MFGLRAVSFLAGLRIMLVCTIVQISRTSQQEPGMAGRQLGPSRTEARPRSRQPAVFRPLKENATPTTMSCRDFRRAVALREAQLHSGQRWYLCLPMFPGVG